MKKYDVIVCGGGTAGMIAASAAARNGANTLLIEREGYPGGTTTYGIPFLGFFSGNGEKVVGGLPQELVDRMISIGGCKGHMRGGEWNQKLNEKQNYDFTLTPFDPESLKYAAQEMLLESGVDILLQADLFGIEKEEGKISAVKVTTVEGSRPLRGKLFIDCTGDALVTRMAGYPTEMRGKGHMQNVTTIIRVGNVNREAMIEGLHKGIGIQGLQDWHIRIVRGKHLDNSEGVIHIAGHAEVFRDKPPITFTGVSWRKEEMSFNITRTVHIDPTSAEDITKAEIQERKNIFGVINGLRKNVPGCKDAYIVSSSNRVGIREGRRIKGIFTLTEEDVLEGKDFDDGIARGAYPIDIHDPKGGKTQFSFIREGGSYSVPYRCLIPEGSKNLLVAGRCVSTTGKALGSVRLMACCMALGQAAGTGAALAVKEQKEPKDISIDALKKKLTEDGAILTV